MLVNVNEFLEFPRPLFSNIVYIGGLGMTTAAKGLAEPLRSVAERGREGFVFFSMGSIVDSRFMDRRFFRHLFEAFSHFPDLQFIARFSDGDDLARELAQNASAGNVHVTGWAPQVDLLAHPRLRLFITHGGYGSLMEAALNGVPLISMGVFGDQFRNARVAERNGWGLAFDKRQLLHGPGEFEEALGRVLNEPRFLPTFSELSNIFFV